MIALALAQAALVLGLARLIARRRSHVAAVAVTLMLLFIGWAMATSPARYAPYFYAHGGLLRTIQVLAMRAGPLGVVLFALSVLALYLARTRTGRIAMRADILLLTATTWPDGNAYPRSYEGLDHAAIATHFRDLGYDVRTVAVPRSERSHNPALLFLPIVDTPLARVLAPDVERSAHAGEPAFVAREAKRVLASPHERPLFLDVRFDATDAPFDIPPSVEPVNDADDAPLRAAAATVEAAVAELTPLATTIFTADHGRTPFAPVPLRGNAEDWLGLQTGEVVVVRGPTEPSTGLPVYMSKDAAGTLFYHPKRTGAEYTNARADLKASLWKRFAEDGLVEEEGYAVPPLELPYRVEIVEEPLLSGVTFSHSANLSPSSELLRVVELTKTGTEPIYVSLGPPLVIAVPGWPPRSVDAWVGWNDLVPTLRDLAGLERHGGFSLVPYMKGEDVETRAALTYGPEGVRTLHYGDRSLVIKEGQFMLEGTDASALVEMIARLNAEEAGVPIAGSRAALQPVPRATWHLRFAGAGSIHRIEGSIYAGAGHIARAPGAVYLGRVESVEPVGVARDAFKIVDGRVDFALMTSPTEVVGLDVVVEPAWTTVGWRLSLDDGPWPVTGVFLGCHGLATRLGASGLPTEELRARATCAEPPALDPRTDLGMLVTR